MTGGLHVTIERIVLHGLEPVDAGALAAALEEALTVQLAAAPPDRPADVARARARIDLPRDFTPGQLGEALAGSLRDVIAGAGFAPDTSGRRATGGTRDA